MGLGLEVLLGLLLEGFYCLETLSYCWPFNPTLLLHLLNQPTQLPKPIHKSLRLLHGNPIRRLPRLSPGTLPCPLTLQHPQRPEMRLPQIPQTPLHLGTLLLTIPHDLIEQPFESFKLLWFLVLGASWFSWFSWFA
jgi:hypothetical protein